MLSKGQLLSGPVGVFENGMTNIIITQISKTIKKGLKSRPRSRIKAKEAQTANKWFSAMLAEEYILIFVCLVLK
jgi:hypothetical protein